LAHNMQLRIRANILIMDFESLTDQP
jgi:hypothetical protein